MKKAVVLFVFCFLGLISVRAQISQGGSPLSFNKSNALSLQANVPTQAMPSVDVQRLSSEDLTNDLNKEIPWRFGENIPVDIDIKTDGVTDMLAKGNKLYRLRVYAAGAFSINLTFDDYRLPPGAKLFIYNEQKTQVLGAFTDFNNQADKYFATTLVQGDAVIIEYFEPKNAQFEGTLHLSRVTHGYRNVLDFSAKAFGTSGNCNNNVVCPLGVGWENEVRSVCMLVVGGSGFCTGAMVNNTAQDGTPYVLTANHCSTSNDFASWVFWWNWQSATCTNPGTSPAHDQTTTSGSTLKARNAGSDFCLVQMNQTPPSTFNVYYSGWNNSATAATSTMCIHHPDGDIKKISSAGPATSVTYSGAQCWNVDWTSGVTEPGSSGSPLFDQNHLIIGQLYGGPSACGVAPGSLNDNYGDFSVSWNAGGSPATRLVDWLDPANTNPTTLTGFDPNVPAVTLDAKANAVIDPVTSYCTVQNISPLVEIANIGSTNLTSLTVSYHIDGGTNVNQNWTGNLATNATAQVTFPQIALTSGTHRFYFSVASPNGGTDLNTVNDTLSVQYVVGGTNLPFTEGFEGGAFPPSFWSINNPDNSITWTSSPTSGNGASTTSAFIDFFNYNPVGELDDLVSPIIDLTGFINVGMTFNVSYRRYDNTTNDGLDIYISTDCGVTFDPAPIYSKSGTVLATGADDLNAFTPSVANDWRLETVDLTPYVGNNIVLQFQAVNAFGNNLYIDDINIISITVPPVADFTQSDTSSCTGAISFTDLSTNSPTSWLWDFGDGTTDTVQNPSHTYTQSGYFTVALTATNTYGNDTVTKTNLIHINLPTVPVTADVSRCGTGSVTLTATGTGTLQWYDAASGGAFLGSGTSYTTPSLTNTTSYYVENHIEQASQFVTTPLSDIDGATYFNGSEAWLVFDVLADLKLVSVEVNASTAGNRLIELRDNTGTAVYSVTINIPSGISRINLGFDIPVGTGYMLVGPPNANLWRNSANVAYPYSLAGIVDITNGGRTGTPVITSRFYYFHNWEVKLVDCISSRSTAVAIINSGVTAGTASASPASVTPGSTSNLTLTGSTGNIQWQESANGIIGWANVTGGSGATTANYTTAALNATTYYRALVSSAGCTDVYSNVISVTVSANPLLANIISTNVSCNGGSDGYAVVTVTGGTSPFTYIWSNGAFNDTISNLATGVYTVTVIDASFSNTTASVTITEPTPINTVATISDVSCNGGNNGSISIVVTGGTSPYTFIWSNAATTQNLNSLTAGSYSVTVTDSLSCTSIVNMTITEPTLLSASISAQSDVSCNSGNDGSATVSASGGSGAYSYLWSNGETTATANNLVQGTFIVTVTDANACTDTATVSISQPPAILLTINTTNATCGNTDGSATVTVTGGTGAYTYDWSNLATTATNNNIAAGIYYVTVTDANGCTATDTANVVNTGSPTLTISGTNVSCNGGTNGSATVSATGGATPYTYLWSNNDTTATINNLAAGSYTVTVTDASICIATASVAITEPAPFVASYTATPILCFGGNSTVIVSATGGTPPYTGTGTFPIPAGTYSIPITDANNCSSTISGTITEPAAITATTSVTNATCGNLNGSISVSATGGTGSFTYLWSNADTTAVINNLAAGSYSVTVTDANSCTAISTANVGNISGPALTISVTDATCSAANGSATVSASGGTGPYTYIWSDGTTTSVINNIAAGSYTVTVTDANSCTATSTANVSNTGGPALTINGTDVACNGASTGSATVSATGGATPYTYLWSSGGTGTTENNLGAGTYSVSVTDNNNCIATASVNITEPAAIVLTTTVTDATCGASNGSASVTVTGGTGAYSFVWSNASTTATINNIAAGSYSVTVTDANGCSANATANISNAGSPTLTITGTNLVCNGGTNGSATVSATGGSSPYSYLWSNGGTGVTENNLSAGTYSVSVTDNSACVSIASISITEPQAITLATSIISASCGSSNGSAGVSVTGGTGAYTYIWSNGSTNPAIFNIPAGSYTVTVTDANTCTAATTANVSNTGGPALIVSGTDVACNGASTGSATVSATGGATPYTYLWSSGGTGTTENNLGAGTYSVSVTDNNNCIATASVNITEPAAIVLTTTVTDATCSASNGSASVTATGGTGAYSFIWSNASTTATINNIAAGSYSVTVTDANTCTVSANANVSNTGSPAITISGTDVTCNGASTGSATVSATGGASPYSYLWPSGGTGATENNLGAGTYTVTVTDNNGCVSSSSVSIYQPSAISLTTGASDASCGSSDGSAVVVASGGTGAYTYNWSNGGTTETIANLSAGVYFISVTDANGCLATSFANVSNSGASALTMTGTTISCNGYNNGSATVSTTGGNPPFTYLWSTGATTTTITNLVAGTYFISVTDANGCIATGSLALTEPGALGLTTVVSDATCFGSGTGSATVAVTGGTPDYAYSWSNGGVAAVINNVTAGSYGVTVTDNNGCMSATSVIIAEPSQVAVSATVTNVSVAGGSDGAITLAVSGGNQPYTFTWSNGATTQNAGNLAAGIYTVTVTDGNGCNIILSDTVLDGPTSVASASIPFYFNVYPNPGNGLLNLEFISVIECNVEIKITNIEGKSIFNSEFPKSSMEFNRSIDLGRLPKGVYHLHMTADKFVAGKVIIIQ